MTIDELVEYTEKINITITREMQEQLLEYAKLLAEWNEKMNLTSIVQLEDVIEKHFLDCILPLSVCDVNGSVVDVGSGAGFPGMVYAIVRPDLQLTLLEPTGKRCQFLNEVVKVLKLGNVAIVNERAEDFAKNHRGEFDVATARAVAGLQMLSELCVPLIKVGGKFLAMKGSQAEQECKDAAHALNILGCNSPNIINCTLPHAGERNIVVCVKGKATPGKYPRAYGQIKKKPL